MREFVSDCITLEGTLQQGRLGGPALHAHRALALIMGWLWMLFYDLAPQDQDGEIQ